MAQEAGRAAAWLAHNGLPAASYFDLLLRQTDGIEASQLTPSIVFSNAIPEWQTSTQSFCPVVYGSVISDLGSSLFKGSSENLASGALYSPGILLAFVAYSAKSSGVSLQINIDGHSVVISSDGWLETTDLDFLTVKQAEFSLKESSVQISAAPSVHRRAAISNNSFEYLGTLAHRTYVPASEESPEADHRMYV